MCLSSVYQAKDGREEEMCSQVSQIQVQEGVVTCTDIMGQTVTLSGTVSLVDLVGNKIVVEAGD